MVGHDAKEDEENPDTMLEKIMKSGHDARKPKAKRRDLIQAQCRRTRHKNGSNPGTMLENLKQKEWIKSRHDVEEPETKRRNKIQA